MKFYMELDYNQTYKILYDCSIFKKLDKSFKLYYKKAKVKLSHYKPGQALKAPGGSGSQNFYTVGTWSALCTVCLYTPFNIHGTLFC
jgi:hypothetical protein